MATNENNTLELDLYTNEMLGEDTEERCEHSTTDGKGGYCVDCDGWVWPSLEGATA